MKKRLKTTLRILMFLCMILCCNGISNAAVKEIALKEEAVTVKRGETVRLRLNGASGKVKWKSNRKKIAVVSPSGKVLGKKTGICEITAVYRKKEYKCIVTVIKSTVDIIREKHPVRENKRKILLAGSSSIARWKSAAAAFAPYETVNVGKSGSTMKQWSKWYKELILPYKPKAIIWYVGGNDLWKDTPPEKVAKMLQDTSKKIHKALPKTKIYFVSVYTNISRESISKRILAYNKKMKQYCKNKQYFTYIDLATVFNGTEIPLEQLLVDGLHPNAEGYKIWADVIVPKIKADMKKSNRRGIE